MLTLLLSFLLFASPSLEATTSCCAYENIEADKFYSVIATTEGLYDYSVSLRVEANCMGSSCSIIGVEVATDYGFKSVSHSSMGGKHWIQYDGYTYYFKF